MGSKLSPDSLATLKYVRGKTEPMRRAIAAVAVALLVVLAGCGGAPATETTVDDSDETTATTDADDDELQRVTVPSDLVAPGGDQRGITDAQTLLQAHLGELEEMRYRSTVTHAKLYTAGNFDAEGESTYEITAGNGTFTTNRESVENGTTTVEDVYSTDQATFVRSDNGTATDYRYGNGPVPMRLQQYARPSHPSASLLFVYTEVSTGMQATGFATKNGEQVVRYEATGATSDKLTRYGGVLGAPNGTVEDLSLTMYVDTDGVVHEATGEMTISRQDGETRERALRFELSALGEADPAKPSWTSEVPQLDGSLNADNDLLAVENVGNETLTEYDVTLSDSVIVQRGNVTAESSVNSSLAPGETVYMYVTGSGDETVLHVSATRPDVPGDARTLTGNGRAFLYLGAPSATIDLGIFKNTTSERVETPETAASAVLATSESATSDGGAFLGARPTGLRL